MPTYANLRSVWGERPTFRFSGRENVRGICPGEYVQGKCTTLNGGGVGIRSRKLEVNVQERRKTTGTYPTGHVHLFAAAQTDDIVGLAISWTFRQRVILRRLAAAVGTRQLRGLHSGAQHKCHLLSHVTMICTCHWDE